MSICRRAVDEIKATLNTWHLVGLDTEDEDRPTGHFDWCLGQFGDMACEYYPSYRPGRGFSFPNGVVECEFDDDSVWECTFEEDSMTHYVFKNEQDAILFKLRWG